MSSSFRDHLTLRMRSKAWFIPVCLVLIMVPAGFEMVVAQPQGLGAKSTFETSDATFVRVGEHANANINNIAYTIDDGRVFDIYFACSSTRGTDPLRLRSSNDLNQVRSYFNDEKRYSGHFERYGKYCINTKHIAYFESTANSVTVYFTARVADAFVQLTLDGVDAENFRTKRQ